MFFLLTIVASLRVIQCVFFLMIRRPPRSTLDRSSAASDVYKRQGLADSADDLFDDGPPNNDPAAHDRPAAGRLLHEGQRHGDKKYICLLYTSDAADERSSVDLGGRRIIKKKKS